MSKLLSYTDVTFGTDPEFFFTQGGKIIGAERVLTPDFYRQSGLQDIIVLDGVQAELHVSPASHTLPLFTQIAWALKKAEAALPPGIAISLAESVEVDADELSGLSPAARELGCAPSLNIYDGPSVIDVPAWFRTRSAGGHLHLGLAFPFWDPDSFLDDRRNLIPMLDLVVGNTCVLLNRGPAQAIRRRTYGKAGEYRLPSHGVEYRTLSNFWLRSPILLDLVVGLARFVLDVVYTAGEEENGLDDRLMASFDYIKVRQAIDTNDPGLAWENFLGIQEAIADMADPVRHPLNAQTLGPFSRLVSGAFDLDAVFPVKSFAAQDAPVPFGKWISTGGF